MPVSFSNRVRIAPDVLFRVVGDEAVLVNLNTEMYLGLNAVGARMWSLLGSSRSIEAACDALIEEYDVDAAELRRDLAVFVDQLLDQKLLEPVAAS
jgi:hypothetical protein